jgi:hypothetical protein
MSDRQERCEVANRMLAAIASCGRRFFHHDGNLSRFEVDGRGRVWFLDGYSNRRVYTHYRGKWRGFTNGGTLRALCEALSDFIMTGRAISPWHFGPFPDWSCGGDLWGYGADMAAVREAALRLGVVSDPSSNPTERSIS